MNTYKCSNGQKVTQAQIDRNYSKMLKEKHIGEFYFICSGCGGQAHDNSHIISRQRCKEIGKTELIWDERNVVNACRECHHKWENFKSGEWRELKNYVPMLRYLQRNDPEGLKIRENFTKN